MIASLHINKGTKFFIFQKGRKFERNNPGKKKLNSIYNNIMEVGTMVEY